MGKLNYYTKAKLTLLLLTICINLCFVIAVHFIVANNERSRLYDKKDVSTANSLVWDGYMLLNEYENGEKTLYEVYEELYQGGFYNDFLAWYNDSTDNGYMPSLDISYRNEIHIDNNFLISSPVYENEKYVGFIDYAECFDFKELSSFYENIRYVSQYDGIISIYGIQISDGRIYPSELKGSIPSKETIVDENGNKIDVDVEKEIFNYQFNTPDIAGITINYMVSRLFTPLYRPLSKEVYDYRVATNVLEKARNEYYTGISGEWLESNEGSFSSLFMLKDIRIEAFNNSIINWNDNIFMGYALHSNVMGNTAKSLVFFDILVLMVLIPMFFMIEDKLINMLRKSNLKEENQRRKLTTAIAHELKTPLAIIESYEEAMSDGKISDEKKEKYQSIIHDEVIHMNQLILDLLELSKIESSELEQRLEVICLSDVIEEMRRSYAAKLEEKKIAFISTIENETVIADKKLLTLVFSNLISNAIKAVDLKGIIKIDIEKQRDKYKISILNNGTPLDVNQLQNLFNPKLMHQEYSESTILGSGLGLIIVKAILKLYTNEYGASNQDGLVCFWFKLGFK